MRSNGVRMNGGRPTPNEDKSCRKKRVVVSIPNDVIIVTTKPQNTYDNIKKALANNKHLVEITITKHSYANKKTKKIVHLIPTTKIEQVELIEEMKTEELE